MQTSDCCGPDNRPHQSRPERRTSANSTLPQPTRAARLPLLLSTPNLVYLINDVSISSILTVRFIIPAVLIPSLFPCATPDGCIESGSINRIFSAANAASHHRRPFVRFPVQDAVLTISGPFPQSIRRPGPHSTHRISASNPSPPFQTHISQRCWIRSDITVQCSTSAVHERHGATMAAAKTTTLTFRIEPSLKDALRTVADQEHRSIANMVEVMIRDYCGRNRVAIAKPGPGSSKTKSAARTR